MKQLDDLLASAEVVFADPFLNAIDQIVPPGTDVGIDAASHVPPALS